MSVFEECVPKILILTNPQQTVSSYTDHEFFEASYKLIDSINTQNKLIFWVNIHVFKCNISSSENSSILYFNHLKTDRFTFI